MRSRNVKRGIRRTVRSENNWPYKQKTLANGITVTYVSSKKKPLIQEVSTPVEQPKKRVEQMATITVTHDESLLIQQALRKYVLEMAGVPEAAAPHEQFKAMMEADHQRLLANKLEQKLVLTFATVA